MVRWGLGEIRASTATPLGRLWRTRLAQVSPDAHSPLDEDDIVDPADDRIGDGIGAGIDDDEIEDEEHRQRAKVVMEELAESRRRIADVPATQVIENHLLGFYELASIHLTAGKDHLREAALAIDALGAVVEGLAGRLGDNEALLQRALQQIRLTFVQVKATL